VNTVNKRAKMGGKALILENRAGLLEGYVNYKRLETKRLK